MESVIIAAPFPYDEKLRSRLERVGPVTMGALGVLVIDDGSTRVYVDRNDAVHDEYEPEALNRIKAIIPAPLFYSIDFTDMALCRKVLEALVDDPNLLVDNDHGILLPGSEFIRMLRSRPDWDWRIDDP